MQSDGMEPVLMWSIVWRQHSDPVAETPTTSGRLLQGALLPPAICFSSPLPNGNVRMPHAQFTVVWYTRDGSAWKRCADAKINPGDWGVTALILVRCMVNTTMEARCS